MSRVHVRLRFEDRLVDVQLRSGSSPEERPTALSAEFIERVLHHQADERIDFTDLGSGQTV